MSAAAFPILYAGMSADDELISIIRDLRILSVASTCVDNKLRTLDFSDLAAGIDVIIDRLEPILDFLEEVDFEGCIERFAACRRLRLELRTATPREVQSVRMTGGDRHG